MKTLVRITKMAGETGLRKPGTLYHEVTPRAEMLAKLGLVEIVKEDKTAIETKELKQHKETKKRRK